MTNTQRILSKIRHLELKTRGLVEASFAGAYRSVFKGRGMNFEEVREYAPGDEVRTIDWNVTARTGRPFVKKFTEEREMTVMLVVDVSASGGFGSVRLAKRELAAEVACVLAFSAVRNGDKVGLLLFADGVELYLPPQKGRTHALRLIREILFFVPKGRGTEPGEALRFMNRVLTRRAVVFLLSDFQSAPFERELGVTARRHDLIAIPVADPVEEGLPDVGIVAFEDAESGEQVEIDTGNGALRAAFAHLANKRREALARSFQRRRVDAITLKTDADYLPALRQFFRVRERRAR